MSRPKNKTAARHRNFKWGRRALRPKMGAFVITMALWQIVNRWGQHYSRPQNFNRLAAALLRWLVPLGWLTLALALLWGLAFAPADYQQKNSFRIIYIHVPAAVLSLFIYTVLALAALCHFIWRWPLAGLLARASAGYGALMTLLALITGSLWGKPTWGTYWTWDARLTSELILLFLYLGYLLLVHSLDERALAERLAALLAMVGLINIPIIHYSVQWWNSLHQGATLFKLGAPSIAAPMLYPLLLALLAFFIQYVVYALRQMGNLLLERRMERLLEQ